MAKNWIASAIKNPDSFTAYCGGKVTQACIERGKKSKDPTTRKRAVLAQTLRRMNKKKR